MSKIETKSLFFITVLMISLIKHLRFFLMSPKMLTIIARTGTVVGEGDGFVTLPLYAAGFAKHRQHSQYVKMVNLSELKVPEGE